MVIGHDLYFFYKEHEGTKASIEKQRSELSEVKKESHKRKKMLAAQQQMIVSGVESYHKVCVQSFMHLIHKIENNANIIFVQKSAQTPNNCTSPFSEKCWKGQASRHYFQNLPNLLHECKFFLTFTYGTGTN